MNESLSAIQEQYASSLLEYLRTGGEAARARAYEIGRQALSQGLGILEMASIHHQAVQAARQATERADARPGTELPAEVGREGGGEVNQGDRAVRVGRS